MWITFSLLTRSFWFLAWEASEIPREFSYWWRSWRRIVSKTLYRLCDWLLLGCHYLRARKVTCDQSDETRGLYSDLWLLRGEEDTNLCYIRQNQPSLLGYTICARWQFSKVEPLFNEVLDITNDIPHLSKSKTYGKEHGCNEKSL